MKKKVADFIGKYNLLSREGLHLVALSGGADSVALLLILKDLGYRIEAAHCNFHLRGEESNQNEEFVKNLCMKENIPLHLIHFETREYANLHQVSIEMAARDLRYGYFHQLINDLDAESVCVAHHRDDVVETFIMNLMRGSGIHGLTGIRAMHDKIARPLLCVSRQEIEDYLHSIGQRYVVDSTNLIDDVLRNKIRLNVLPLLEQLNPHVAVNIGKSAQFLKEAEKVVDAVITQQKKELIKYNPQRKTETVSITDLKQLTSPELFLHEWLAEKGFNSTHVEQLAAHLEGSPGRTFETADYTLLIDREHLVLAPHEMPMKPLRIPEPGRYRINENHCIDIKDSRNVFISKSNNCITIDKAKVKYPLTIRLIENGDSFIPYGMTGKKLVSDFLTDIKCSLLEKRNQMVITDSEGQIVWLIGKRIDNRFRVTEQTTQVLQMTLTYS